MIKINKISKKYNDFTFEVKDINIKKGEVIAIIGSNGSGKTTFVEAITNLRKMDVCDIEFSDDINFNAVFQESSFDNNFKVREIIKMYSDLYKLKGVSFDEVYKEYDLEKIKNRSFGSLSGGEKQKLKIAVAFLNRPKVIILDEVSTALDITWQRKIFEKINKFKVENPDSTIIMITHNLKDVVTLSDRVIIMKDGKQLKIMSNKKGDEEKTLKELEGIAYE